MHLTQLNHAEQLILVGLYYWMIHADQVVSDEERDRLARMRKLWGDDHWLGLETEAKSLYPSARELALGCRQIDRPPARQAIYDELIRLAGVDDYHPAEVKLLNWLAVTWGFADATAVHEAEADLDGDAEAEDMESFDLFG